MAQEQGSKSSAHCPRLVSRLDLFVAGQQSCGHRLLRFYATGRGTGWSLGGGPGVAIRKSFPYLPFIYSCSPLRGRMPTGPSSCIGGPISIHFRVCPRPSCNLNA
ncbi:hypothetical protein J6590_025034 [Homalodisca vitripennis]|nr:hypothetical protein J6590_025034 [Homalodisca vitripennis]